jgi:hypothetical protein
MQYSKIITKKGMPLLDLTRINVAPETLALGVTAINREGELVVGVAEPPRSGVTDVEALPIENIDSQRVYRLTEEVVLAPTQILIKEKGNTALDYLDYFETVLRPDSTLTLKIVEVSELPDNPSLPVINENLYDITIYVIGNGLPYSPNLETNEFEPLNIQLGMEYNGVVTSKEATTNDGIYTIKKDSYFVWHYWNYNDQTWYELIDNIEVEELPTEDIRRDACYVKNIDGVKFYFIYGKDSWIGYTSGGGSKTYLDYITGENKLEFVVPDSTETIAPYVFYKREYEQIILPVTLRKISHHAFFECANLKEVYYCGSETDWNNLIIEEGNEPLVQANKIYDYEILE